jgi:hypothetical protein
MALALLAMIKLKITTLVVTPINFWRDENPRTQLDI